MDAFSNFINGLLIVFQPNNLLYCFIGVSVGTLVGVLPGLGPAAIVAILLPIRFAPGLLSLGTGGGIGILAFWLLIPPILNLKFKEAHMRSRLQKDVRKMVFASVILSLGFLSVAGPIPAIGQERQFPSRSIEVIVPFSPSGPPALTTQIFADPLSRELKVPITVTHKQGAGGMVGSLAFLKTQPDGHTMLAVSGLAILLKLKLSKTPPFDMKTDLLPVAYIGDMPIVMAVPKKAPYNSFHEFVQYAKSNPGKLRGGFSVPGGETHALSLGLIKETNIDTKLAPYPQGQDLETDILGGHLDWYTPSYTSSLRYVRSGDLKLLLATSKLKEFPSVPTGPEVGLPVFSLGMWVGMFVHSKTPKPAYERLVAAVKKISEEPEIAKKLANIGINFDFKDPRAFSNLINDQWEDLDDLIKKTGLKAE